MHDAAARAVGTLREVEREDVVRAERPSGARDPWIGATSAAAQRSSRTSTRPSSTFTGNFATGS